MRGWGWEKIIEKKYKVGGGSGSGGE